VVVSAKLLLAGAAVALTRLALATLVIAQVAPLEPPAQPLRARVELGPVGGMTVIFPEFGILASVPLDRRTSVEVMVSRLMPQFDAPPHALAQVQFRTPFRADLQSRKSFVLGLTRINAQDDSEGFLDDGFSSHGAFVRPHAGVSLQWPLGRDVDFRFDAHGIVTFVGELPLLPRAVTAIVWHPGRRGDRANRGRTWR
jgi:hypothetical protein